MLAELRLKSVMVILKKSILWLIIPLFMLWFSLPYFICELREEKIFEELSSSEISPGYRVQVTVDYNYGQVIEGKAVLSTMDDPDEDYFAIATADHEKYILLKTNNALDRSKMLGMIEFQKRGKTPQAVQMVGRIRKARGLFYQEKEAIEWVIKTRGIPEDSFLPYVIDCDLTDHTKVTSTVLFVVGSIWLLVIVLIILWFVRGRNLRNLYREIDSSPYTLAQIENDYRNATVIDKKKGVRIGTIAVYVGLLNPHMFCLEEIESVAVVHLNEDYSEKNKKEYSLMIKPKDRDRYLADMSSKQLAERAKMMLIQRVDSIQDGQNTANEILTRGEKGILSVD